MKTALRIFSLVLLVSMFILVGWKIGLGIVLGLWSHGVEHEAKTA